MKRPIKQTAFLLLTLLLAAGCTQNDDYFNPDQGNLAYVAFYNASEVSSTNRPFFLVYVNDTTEANSLRIEEGIIPYRRRNLRLSNHRYVPLRPDSYRFIFTNGARDYRDYRDPATHIYIAEEELQLAEASRTTIYMTDDVNDREYRTVVTADNARRIEGKVQVRIINLSPDAGTLQISRTYHDGRKEAVEALSPIPFTEYTPYVPFDIAGTEQEAGYLTLEMQTSGAPVTVGVAAMSGSIYTIVVQGFVNPTTRSIITGRDDQQQLIYNTVSLPSDCRATVIREK